MSSGLGQGVADQFSWRFLGGAGDFSVESGISLRSRDFSLVLDWEKCGYRVGIEAEPFRCVSVFRGEVVWLLVGVLFSSLKLGNI